MAARNHATRNQLYSFFKVWTAKLQRKIVLKANKQVNQDNINSQYNSRKSDKCGECFKNILQSHFFVNCETVLLLFIKFAFLIHFLNLIIHGGVITVFQKLLQLNFHSMMVLLILNVFLKKVSQLAILTLIL